MFESSGQVRGWPEYRGVLTVWSHRCGKFTDDNGDNSEALNKVVSSHQELGMSLVSPDELNEYSGRQLTSYFDHKMLPKLAPNN